MMHGGGDFLHEENIVAGHSLLAGWEFDPAVAIPLAASLLLYGLGLARLWRRAGWGRGVTAVQAGLFAGGWLTLLVALVSPLHEYGEHLFLAHMVEHELLMAVAAPLLALSRPLGTFLHAFPRPWRLVLIAWCQPQPAQMVWEWLNRPITATVLHGAAIWIWHIPILLDATIRSEGMHRLQHISFLVTALFFWWAIIRRPVREYGLGAAHVFATMMHTGFLGALLTLAPRVFYPLQTVNAPQFGLTPLQDQQLAGLFMWVPGGALYLAAGLWLIGRWLSSDALESDEAELSAVRGV
jgi:cytochrome c oxidase assembly factor CtaG